MAAIASKVAKFSDWREAIDFFRASGASGASGPSGVGNVGNVGKGNSKTNVGNRMNVGVLDFTLQSLARQDQWQWCLQILDEVKEQRFWPHQMAYCHAIQASRRQGRWDVSLSLVASCEEQGLVPDTPMLNLAIGSCGYGREWERAIALLSEFPLRRLQCSDYSYNAAFGALGSSRQWAHVLALVESMASTRVALDRGMRESAARSAALGKRQMQIDVTESLSTADWQEAIDCLVAMQLQSLQADIRVHNAVISACRRSTKWAEALACFEDVPAKDRTVVTATTLLGCLGDAGLWQEALHRFSLIRSDNAANVDPYMCNTVLQAFKNSGKWQWCLWLLTEMSHSISSNSLASKSRPPSLPPPDTLSFNTVIGSAAESGRWQLAFDLLRVMALQKERPNVRTFNAAIAACAEASEWQRALLLQQELPKHQLKPTDVTYVSLLKAMNSANELHRSLKMLKEMRRENVAPGATAYSGVIAACGTHGKYDTAKGLLDEMRQFQVESNAVVLNAAMSAFIKCGILGDAYQIYYDMSKQQVRPDLETYNTLMQSFVQQSYWEGALHTLETIRSSTQDPDAISYTTAIDACRKGSFWQEAIHLCWEMRLQHVQPDIITFGATIAACAEGARSDGSGSWAFALKLFDEAQLEGLTMSTPCLNNALQACVIASYWESSLALASELNGSLEYVAPDLVNSNLQLAALTMSHQWKHALHLLKHNFSQRGHQIDASTYNSANIGMPEPQTELVGGQRTTGEEDTATGVQEFREYLMRTFIESDVGRKAFFSGDHVLDLHGMSLSSAKMALQLALDDAKQKPRTLLIVTGQGKHSTGEPLLKEGVASMLDKLQLHARAVAGGFYVQTWRGEHKHKNGNLVKELREAVDAHESAGVNKKWLGQGGSMPSSIRQLDYWSAIEAFELYDSKRLGFLDKPAFYTMLRGLTRKRDYMDEKLSDHIFDEIDINQSGGIDKEEFLGWVFETNNFRLNHLREKLVDMSEEEVQKIFRKIDKTGDGQLDKEEFWHFIQSIGGIPPEASGDLHEFIDSDNSGLISFDEFLNWVHPDRELELLEKHHADWKLDLVRLSDYQRPEKPLMETRPGKPVVIELWIGPDYKFMADRMKLMLCQMFSPEQVHWEFKMDGRISGTCSLVLAKVGRGIELWNRDSMMAYREDPFLDSSGSTARKWLTDVLHKCLPDVERASNLHRLKQRRHLAHHRQGSKQKH